MLGPIEHPQPITMTTAKSQTGTIGEQVAANFLKQKGYEILDMNFQNDSGRRLGEIDIIARDNEINELVFVEVKTRDYQKYGKTLPEENITRQKMRRLARIAEDYLRKNKFLDSNYRFDAISVWIDEKEKRARIKHIRSL